MSALSDALALPDGRVRRAKPGGKERTIEQQRRNALARARAVSALAKLHPDEYRALYIEALGQVNAERGPLPEVRS